jgi:hypothetical protein
MAMKNIELFDLYVGKIFVLLYEEFPVRKNINACDFLGYKEKYDESNYTDKEDKECGIFESTMEWLQESGYILYKEKSSVWYIDVILSAKGLELLKAVPESVRTKKSIGEHINHLARESTDESLKQAVNMLLSMGLKMFG